MAKMIEQFDVLDMDGNPTGRRYDKGTQLSDGQYYLGVHVYIFDSSCAFLLQQRSYDKAFLPGGWDVLLEHVIAGETSKQGAIRGIKEEIGISVAESDVRLVRRFIWTSRNNIMDIYFAKLDFDVNDLVLQSSEVIDAKMISKEDMLEFLSNMNYRPVAYRKMVAVEIEKTV